MSSFIWPCAVLLALLWTGIDSRVKPLQSPGSLCSGSMDDKSFSGTAHTHTHAHAYKHMHTKLLCDTRLEARVTHANETGPASSRQRSVILHSSASLQKPKSFSPPSPVIVTLMERRSGNHLLSHTVGRNHKCFSFSRSGEEKKEPPMHKFQYWLWHLTHVMNKNSSARSPSCFWIGRRRAIRQISHKAAGLQQWYKLCIFSGQCLKHKTLRAIKR